ncbi:hypothetical protein Tco_0089050 [Tanacetum coccineum]
MVRNTTGKKLSFSNIHHCLKVVAVSLHFMYAADGNQVTTNVVREYTIPPEEGIEGHKAPAIDIQSIDISRNVRILPIGSRDTVNRYSSTTSAISRFLPRSPLPSAVAAVCLNKGESSSTGYSPSLSAQLFSSVVTTTDTHSHSFNAAYQRMMHLIFFHKLLIKIFDPHDVPFYSVENGSHYISTNARCHAFSTASQRETSACEIASFNNGKRRKEFHQVFPPSTRYPRTSNRNIRSGSERPVSNELAASSTAPTKNIQRIDHGLPQSTYTRTEVDANESPPYKDLGDCH